MDRVIVREGSLTIREMRADQADFALMARWLSDPRVLEFYEGRDRPFTIEQVMEDFDPAVMNEERVTPCILCYDRQPVGYLQFYPADREEYQFEEDGAVYALDLFIGEPDYWNRGIGTKFVSLLLNYLFAEEKADWVVIDPHVDNPRAIRSYEKAGFRKVKILPGHEWHEGRYVDCWLMAVQKPFIS